MARVTWRVALIATAILAVAVLAACGGGSSSKDKNAYAKKVNAAQTNFAQTVSTVAQAGDSKNSVSQQQKTLRRFETAIDGVVRELRGIDAPSEVTKEHERLTAVMTGFGKAISEANDAMRNPTPRTIELAKKRVATATESVNARVNAAIAAINAKLRGK